MPAHMMISFFFLLGIWSFGVKVFDLIREKPQTYINCVAATNLCEEKKTQTMVAVPEKFKVFKRVRNASLD